MSWELCDDYPTEETLQEIRELASKNAARWLVVKFPDLINAMACGTATVEGIDDLGPAYEITITTGGWSGCEDVVDAIPAAVDLSFWYSSQRGGRHVWRVPVSRLG